MALSGPLVHLMLIVGAHPAALRTPGHGACAAAKAASAPTPSTPRGIDARRAERGSAPDAQ
eukprot:2666957-Pleurochrysis_carterae.AAC.3